PAHDCAVRRAILLAWSHFILTRCRHGQSPARSVAALAVAPELSATVPAVGRAVPGRLGGAGFRAVRRRDPARPGDAAAGRLEGPQEDGAARMTAPLVDSHSHFDAAEFDADRAAVLERARAAGVARQLVPAVDAAGWPKLREVCAGAPGLYPAYGLHPTFLDRHAPEHLLQLREWIERERPLAVGECGLDHFVEGLDRDAQARYFQAQLELAREFDLPVIVHARRAVEAVLLAIRGVGGLRGVVHSFSGSQQQAEQLWDLGFLLGLGGPVTYARARRLRRLAATMPLEY